jgi:hypothetical protein
VPAEGGFLGRAYRASRRFETPVGMPRAPLAVHVTRDPALPTAVEVSVLRLQVSP